MVKFSGDNPATPRRGYALKGVGYSQVREHRTVFAKWPRKPLTPPSEAQLHARALIKSAALICTIIDANQMNFSAMVAENTQLLPRDLMIIQLFGRAFRFLRPDGKVIFSMAARRDVSELLDAIGQLKGMMLFKGDDLWQALEVGIPNDVLQIDPVTGLPVWAPSPVPSGAGSLLAQVNAIGTPTANTGGFAAVGSMMRPYEDFQITELWPVVTASSGEQYAPFIAHLSAYTSAATISSITIGPAVTLPRALTNTTFRLPFSVAVGLQAGEPYALGVVRQDGTGSSVCKVFVCGTDAQSVPDPAEHANLIAYSTTTPAAGRAFDFFQSSGHIVQVHERFLVA